MYRQLYCNICYQDQEIEPPECVAQDEEYVDSYIDDGALYPSPDPIILVNDEQQEHFDDDVSVCLVLECNSFILSLVIQEEQKYFLQLRPTFSFYVFLT